MNDETVLLISVVALYSTGHWVGASILLWCLLAYLVVDR